MSYQNRRKASEIFRDANPVFGKKVSFVEAFPNVEDITIEVREEGHGVGFRFGPIVYRKGSFSEFIDCSNPFCYRGGFSMGSILREMVDGNKTTFTTGKSCQGYEGSPKGARRYRSCMNWFDVKVEIKYKAMQSKVGIK